MHKSRGSPRTADNVLELGVLSVFVRVSSCNFVDRTYYVPPKNDLRALHELTLTKPRGKTEF